MGTAKLRTMGRRIFEFFGTGVINVTNLWEPVLAVTIMRGPVTVYASGNK